MNISELIERLEEIAEHQPDAEVLMAQQPSWPMQTTVLGVVTTDDLADEEPCDEHGDYHCDECKPEQVVVYLVEGDHPADSPYAPRGCWDAL